MKLCQEQLVQLEKWVLTNIQWCVNHPEACQIDIHPHEGSTVIDVTPHPDDVGLLVGRKGRLITAFRTILHVFNRRFNHNVVLHIVGGEAQVKKTRRHRRPDGQSSTRGGEGNQPRQGAGDD